MFSLAFAMAVPFPDQQFDLALCIEVLEHVQEDEKALGEIARVLRSGGSLILSLPYRHWFPSYYKLMGHIRHHTRTDVEAMLARHGWLSWNICRNFLDGRDSPSTAM